MLLPSAALEAEEARGLMEIVRSTAAAVLVVVVAQSATAPELLEKREDAKKNLAQSKEKKNWIEDRMKAARKMLARDTKLLNREGRVVLPFPNEMFLMGYVGGKDGARS